MTLAIKNGRVEIGSFRGNSLRIDAIDARISLAQPKVSLACSSTLWQWLDLEWSADRKTARGKGNARLIGLRPEKLTALATPNITAGLGAGWTHLEMTFETERMAIKTAAFRAADPGPTIFRGRNHLVTRGLQLNGNLQRTPDHTVIQLEHLHLDFPQFTVAGRITLNHDPHEGENPISLVLEGRDIDAASVRSGALLLAGDMDSVKEVFDIVKGGRVTRISMSTAGEHIEDLAAMDRLRIEGVMQNGKIYVPGVRLDLDQVQGEALIARGLLTGRNLSARCGNTLGRDGRLKLGLTHEADDFHLDIAVHADLAQLPPVLHRLLKNPFVHGELGLIDRVEGRANGRLILGESLDAIETRVAVSDFSLTTAYQRLPQALLLQGRGLFIDADGIRVDTLNGTMGQTRFEGLCARINWKAPFDLSADLMAGEILWDDIWPWFISHESWARRLHNIGMLGGRTAIGHLKLDGPLLQPAKWRLEAGGDFHQMRAQTAFFPTPLHVSSGGFDTAINRSGRTAALRNLRVATPDGSAQISGRLQGDPAGLSNADLTIEGRMGSGFLKWLQELMALPPRLAFKPPLSVNDGHLEWRRGGQTDFSGNVIITDGPTVSADIRYHRGRLFSRLQFEESARPALLQLDLDDDVYSFMFDGRLNLPTANKVFARMRFSEGYVQGHLQGRIPRKNPQNASISGTLAARDLVPPPAMALPLKINRLNLAAAGSRIDLKSADFSWEDNPFQLWGRVEFSDFGILVDMDLTAEDLEWQMIRRLAEHGTAPYAPQAGRKNWRLPTIGTIRLRSKTYAYEGMTWRPFIADLNFAGQSVYAVIHDAALCGIETRGSLTFSPTKFLMSINPSARDQQLDDALYCLLNKKDAISGSYDLKGALRSTDRGRLLSRTLKGRLNFNARKGRIYRFNLLANVFSLINITEIFAGVLPDIGTEGLPYDTMDLLVNIKRGTMTIEEAVIKGPSVEIAAQGDVDLVERQLNLRILVAPLKTVDRIVKLIPLIGDILGGTLLSIPVKVTGDMDDPSITYLNPADVGNGLVDMMKRAFQLPVKIIPWFGGRNGSG